MKANHILVDFENVPHLPLDRIGEDSVVFTKPHAFYLALSKTAKRISAERPDAGLG